MTRDSSRLVAARWRQGFGRCALALLLAMALQALFVGDASAQSTMAKPDVAAQAVSGSVVFTWDEDASAERWAVAVVHGSCIGLSAEDTVQQARVVCFPEANPVDALCVSVKGYNDTNATVSAFSNWRCADTDAFGIDPTAGGGYLPEQYWVGRSSRSGDVVPAIADATDCVVDLSFRPYRYFCVANEAELQASITSLAGLAEANDRVFWIGEPGDVAVEDYTPQPLIADISVADELSQTVPSPGAAIEATYTFTHRGPGTPSGGIAPSVGVTYPVTSAFESIETPPSCVRVLDDLRCFGGDLDSEAANGGAVYSFAISGVAADDVSARDFEIAYVIDTDIPAPGEAAEGDNGGSIAGGGGAGGPLGGFGLGTNGRTGMSTPVFDFGVLPGVSDDDDGTGNTDDQPPCPLCGESLSDQAGGARIGGGGGDPHLVTFDGVRYSFQGSGDYVLARSPDTDLEFQVRFARNGPRQVSWNHGFATTVGDSVLTFGDDSALGLWDPTVIKLDGAVITPTSSGLALPGGVTLRLVDATFDQYEVRWPDGTRFSTGVRVGDWWRFEASADIWGNVAGLMGNADGLKAGDLAAQDGTPFSFASLELYSIYGESWLLDADASLFESQLTDDQLLPVIPLSRFSMSDLAAASLAEAEAICRAEGYVEGEGLAECIFDIAITGDQRFIEGADLMRLLLRRSVSALAALGVVEDDTTITLPTVLVGEISTSHKIDVYRFDIAAGESITIDSATTCTNDASFEFVLEAPSGATVGRNQISRTTRCGRIGLFDLPETGEYILRVYDSYGETGQYALAIELPGSSASSYVLDEIEGGTIEAGGQQFHIFQVSEDNTEVYFDSMACRTGNQWQLLDPDLNVVQAQNCFQEFTETLHAGQWTLRVYSNDERGGNYAFRAWQIPERENFDYTLDVSQFGELLFPTDSEAYSFDVLADDTELYFDAQGCASGLRWQLVDPDGNAEPFQNCFQGFTRTLDAGTWTIRVYSIDDRFGTYRFRIWEIPERQNFAYTLDEVQFGQLSFPTDSEAYSFDVVADGAELYFDPQGCASGLRWQLISPTGVASQWENCFEGFTRTLDTGAWTIRVYSPDDRVGTYRFRIWEIPERENFDYSIGDTVNVVLSFPTDSERYSFEVPADNTTLVFDSQGCNPTSQRWRLLRPNGSTVVTRNCFQDFTQTLTAGTYTLRVYTEDDRFGTFQFQVREQ